MCARHEPSKTDSVMGAFLVIVGLGAAGIGSYQLFGPYTTAIWSGALVAWLGWQVT